MNIEEIKLGISNPRLVARRISQVYNQIISQSKYNPNGVDVMNEDWDNLVILDACRYDLFKQINTITGNLIKVESRGSATPEFLRGNFQNGSFLNTVYITTNPMLYKHREKINAKFYDVIDLWRGETWDGEQEIVLPEVVTREAKKAIEQYPNKRLLVHYLQPHYPFIDSDTQFDKGHIGDDEPNELNTWMKIMTGEVSIPKETLWNAYADNLQRALPHVQDLVNEFVGKTVITSDHGNMFGERSSPIPVREWGHPEGIWTDELVKVPWLEVEYAERRDVVAEESAEYCYEDDSPVEERLESLGYV